MKKLHTLKRWLTLEDAATQLSQATNSVVKSMDLLQLCLEGHLSLAWNLGGKPATKISSYTELSNWYGGRRDDPTFQARYSTLLLCQLNKQEVPPQAPAFDTFYRVTAEPDEITYLNGTYKLCLEPDIDLELREWLTFLVTGSEEHTDLVGMLGCVTVEDEQGQKWSILKKRQMPPSQNVSTPILVPSGPNSVVRGRHAFERTDEFPPVKSLAILGAELERFEAMLETNTLNASAPVLRGTERKHYLKVIAGLLACAGISRNEAATEVLRILESKGGQTKLDRATLSVTLKDANEMRPQIDKPTTQPTPKV